MDAGAINLISVAFFYCVSVCPFFLTFHLPLPSSPLLFHSARNESLIVCLCEQPCFRCYQYSCSSNAVKGTSQCPHKIRKLALTLSLNVDLAFPHPTIALSVCLSVCLFVCLFVCRCAISLSSFSSHSSCSSPVIPSLSSFCSFSVPPLFPFPFVKVMTPLAAPSFIILCLTPSCACPPFIRRSVCVPARRMNGWMDGCLSVCLSRLSVCSHLHAIVFSLSRPILNPFLATLSFEAPIQFGCVSIFGEEFSLHRAASIGCQNSSRYDPFMSNQVES